MLKYTEINYQKSVFYVSLSLLISPDMTCVAIDPFNALKQMTRQHNKLSFSPIYLVFLMSICEYLCC